MDSFAINVGYKPILMDYKGTHVTHKVTLMDFFATDVQYKGILMDSFVINVDPWPCAWGYSRRVSRLICPIRHSRYLINPKWSYRFQILLML